MNDTVRGNIRVLARLFDEKIKGIQICVAGDYVVEVKDFPSSELEKLIETFLEFDDIHKSFLTEDKCLEIIMRKYYLDNPSFFDENGQPRFGS